MKEVDEVKVECASPQIAEDGNMFTCTTLIKRIEDIEHGSPLTPPTGTVV